MPSSPDPCEICGGVRTAGIRVRYPKAPWVPAHLSGRRVRACASCAKEVNPNFEAYARGQRARHVDPGAERTPSGRLRKRL